VGERDGPKHPFWGEVSPVRGQKKGAQGKKKRGLKKGAWEDSLKKGRPRKVKRGEKTPPLKRVLQPTL